MPHSVSHVLAEVSTRGCLLHVFGSPSPKSDDKQAPSNIASAIYISDHCISDNRPGLTGSISVVMAVAVATRVSTATGIVQWSSCGVYDPATLGLQTRETASCQTHVATMPEQDCICNNSTMPALVYMPKIHSFLDRAIAVQVRVPSSCVFYERD